MRIQENKFDIGWQECAKRVFGIGQHISATGLHNTHVAPTNLKDALASNNPDRNIWDKSYNEKYDGLDTLKVFTKITTKKYRKYVVKYDEKARFISTMNLFVIKPNMDRNPNRAKSQIIGLGYLERRVWSREDKYTPVLSSTAARLLVLMAVEDGYRLKMTDCRSAFCNRVLPEDKICIVKSLANCPCLKKGTF